MVHAREQHSTRGAVAKFVLSDTIKSGTAGSDTKFDLVILKKSPEGLTKYKGEEAEFLRSLAGCV